MVDNVLGRISMEAFSQRMGELMGADSRGRVPVVLVVEDEPLLLMSAIAIVEDAGFRPIAAQSGAEALSILESRADVSLVFSDLDMPGEIDGLQLFVLVAERWPAIELVLTSGQRLPNPAALPDRCLFFGKPYSATNLVLHMRRALRSDISEEPEDEN